MKRPDIITNDDVEPIFNYPKSIPFGGNFLVKTLIESINRGYKSYFHINFL